MNHKRLPFAARPLLAVLSIGVLLSIAGSTYLVFVFFALDAASLEQGSSNAKELLVALELYKKDNGEYPSAHESLVPTYLSAIPRPARRYEYYYEACSNGSGYILYFRLAGDSDEWCGYSSGTREWKRTDSIPPYYYDRPCAPD